MEHVNHPDHYQLNGMEAIDIIAAVSKEYSGVAAFDVGNALKYIVRAKHKNGEEDIKKAIWYLNHLLSLNDNKDIFVKEYDTNENR